MASDLHYTDYHCLDKKRLQTVSISKSFCYKPLQSINSYQKRICQVFPPVTLSHMLPSALVYNITQSKTKLPHENASSYSFPFLALSPDAHPSSSCISGRYTLHSVLPVHYHQKYIPLSAQYSQLVTESWDCLPLALKTKSSSKQ